MNESKHGCLSERLERVAPFRKLLVEKWNTASSFNSSMSSNEVKLVQPFLGFSVIFATLHRHISGKTIRLLMADPNDEPFVQQFCSARKKSK